MPLANGVAELVVDHVDANPKNNALTNLVPACTKCNVTRSRAYHGHAMTSCVCVRCTKAFETRTAYVRRGGGKFCSDACRLMRYQPAMAVLV